MTNWRTWGVIGAGLGITATPLAMVTAVAWADVSEQTIDLVTLGVVGICFWILCLVFAAEAVVMIQRTHTPDALGTFLIVLFVALSGLGLSLGVAYGAVLLQQEGLTCLPPAIRWTMRVVMVVAVLTSAAAGIAMLAELQHLGLLRRHQKGTGYGSPLAADRGGPAGDLQAGAGPQAEPAAAGGGGGLRRDRAAERALPGAADAGERGRHNRLRGGPSGLP